MRAREGRNYRRMARNPTPRRRLYNAKTSPTCASWHLLNLALASLLATYIPFISCYRSTGTRNQSCCLRLECQRLRVARFVGINVFYSRAASRRACSRTFHRQSNVRRGRFNLVSSSTSANLHSSSFAMRNSRIYVAVYTHVYVYVYICEQTQESKESFREHSQRLEKVGKAYRLVKNSVMRFFIGKLSLTSLGAMQLHRASLLATYKL